MESYAEQLGDFLDEIRDMICDSEDQDVAENARKNFKVYLVAQSKGGLDGTVELDLPTDAQRLIAFHALQGRKVPRTYVAESLWLDSDEKRAFGNLRTAPWRLRQNVRDLVQIGSRNLAIDDAVVIDVARANRMAQRLFRAGSMRRRRLDPPLVRAGTAPGWYDEWAVLERERIHQQSIHALESIAYELLALGRYPEAIEAALATIRKDPCRESASLPGANPLERRKHLRGGPPIQLLPPASSRWSRSFTKSGDDRTVHRYRHHHRLRALN